jgi:hypothetical protein
LENENNILVDKVSNVDKGTFMDYTEIIKVGEEFYLEINSENKC